VTGGPRGSFSSASRTSASYSSPTKKTAQKIKKSSISFLNNAVLTPFLNMKNSKNNEKNKEKLLPINSYFLDIKKIQIFTTLIENDDPLTISYCLIALSNISSIKYIRILLYETNILNKLISIYIHIKEPTGGWAMSLFFYYLSFENSIEDRLLNSSINFLFKNTLSTVEEVKNI
jgi:hypothetical protein